MAARLHPGSPARGHRKASQVSFDAPRDADLVHACHSAYARWRVSRTVTARPQPDNACRSRRSLRSRVRLDPSQTAEVDATVLMAAAYAQIYAHGGQETTQNEPTPAYGENENPLGKS